MNNFLRFVLSFLATSLFSTSLFSQTAACDTVSVSSANGAIIITGMTNTNVVQIFNNDWSASVYNQTLNTATANIPNLSSGQTYHVKIQQYDTKNGPWKFLCEKIIDVTVADTVVTNSCRTQDSLTLVKFYNSTGGANWIIKWDLTKPIDTWYGITLNADGCVLRIELVTDNLIGTIPPNFDFSALIFLRLVGNGIVGLIPNFNSPNLDTLTINGTLLTGILPAFNLPQLRFLNLNYNQLTGLSNINAPKLTSMEVNNNQLTGNIPNFNLPNVINLLLNNNLLTGSIPPFNLPSAKLIVLQTNQLSGTIPDFVLPSIKGLVLSGNNLSGCIPVSLKAYCGKVDFYNNPNLSNQDVVTFCASDIGACTTINPCDTDTTPPVLVNCPQNINLTTASTTATATWTAPTATDNCVTPTIAVNFSSGTAFPIGITTITYSAIDAKLNKATCSFNVVITQQIATVSGCDSAVVTSSGGMINLSRLSNTTYVQVFNNNWSANVFTQTMNTSTLSIPNLAAGQNYHVKIQQYDTSNGPWKFLCEKTIDVTVNSTVTVNSCRTQDSLTLVSLYKSAGGANWTRKWDLTKPIDTWDGINLNANGCVKRIDLNTDNLTGTLPPEFNFSALTGLFLSSNGITGTLPNFNSPNLDTISINGTFLTGTVPAFNLPQLRFLYMTYNHFTGLSNLNTPKLTFFNMNSNQLTGSIPNFNLPNLTDFELYDNKLTGSIPPFNLPNATLVVLAYNQLTGAIPDFVLPNAKGLALSGNNLSGCIPVSLKAYCNNLYSVSFSNNPNLLNQDFASFCSNNTGACSTSTNYLAVSIAATPTSYKQYTNQSFKITVTNTGNTDFTNAQIVLTVPDKLAGGASATTSAGTWNSYCAGGIKCNTWTIPTIAANSTATIDISYFVTDAIAPLTVTATLTASTPTDLNTSNNSASTTIYPPTSGKLATPDQIQFVRIVLEKLAPNPTDGEVSLQLQSIVEKNITFNFSDAFGRQVISEKRPIEKGINNVSFDLSALPHGIYFLQIDANALRQAPVKIVKF